MKIKRDKDPKISAYLVTGTTADQRNCHGIVYSLDTQGAIKQFVNKLDPNGKDSLDIFVTKLTGYEVTR